MELRRLRRYLIRTFAISWLSWGLLALLVGGGICPFASAPGTALFAVGGFGPTIAALTVLEEKFSLGAVGRFLFSRRKKSGGVLLLFCVLQTGVIALSSLELNSELPLFIIPIIFLTVTFFGGGNEELGWRGVMQPILEKKLPFPVATGITGAVWAVWHLPLWFIEGSAQQSLPFLLFAIYAICLSFWLAAVYQESGCVFYCSILHGLSNTLMSVFVIKVNGVLAAGIVLMDILAVLLWYQLKCRGEWTL